MKTANAIARLCCIALVLSLASGCASVPPARLAGPAEPCVPSFPDEDGWFGGDAAFSVSLGAEPWPGSASERNEAISRSTSTSISDTSLWFFGDSFVRHDPSDGARPGRAYPFVHNSIGRSTCDAEGRWRIDYDWQKTQPPRAFFEPDTTADWVEQARSESGASPYYWPLAPFLLGDVLYVGLLRVLPSEPTGPFNLPFRLIGADLARIMNPADTPEAWQIEITPLSDEIGAIPGSAWVIDGPFIYAFGYLNGADGQTPRILSRLPVDAIQRWPEDLSSEIETLGHSGEWEAGLTPSRAQVIMDDDATEMSVHFSRRDRTWLAVYSDPTPATRDAQKGVIWFRRAQRLTGPWSAPQRLTIVPERRPGNALARDPNLFCYAGKAHPQFTGPATVVVTYVCNVYARNQKEIPGTLERLLESPGIYRPRAMRIEIPLPDNR